MRLLQLCLAQTSLSRFIGNHNSPEMLPIAQLNLLPLAQLILIKQAVDAASEQWERERTEGKNDSVLNETLAWSDDSKLGAYTLARGVGTGTAWDDFTDSRSHTYDPDNRRLDTESFLPDPSGSTRTFNYDFDSDDLGVRVKAALNNPATDAWEVNDPATTGLDAFMRVVDETARSGKRNFTVSGSSTGPGIFELYLGEGASPSSFEFLQSIDPDVDYGDGTWQIPLSLEAGQYTLEARGTHLHPDSNYQATDSSTFTVAAPDPANIVTTYDSHGRVETRSWASGDVLQTFSWDAKGNLLEIEQVDSGTAETVGSFVWTAQYDGLGRRIITDYAPAGASAIAIAQNRIKTWYDPQVEFMVAAVEHHGKREWLVHGPDLDTGYGAFQGLGGLEAIVDEATGETTPIVDTVHGHVVATISLGDIANAADDTVTFKEQQFGGYGPLPGSQQKPLETTESLSESLGWQTRCVDPTSFFAMGARHYDPLSGRFLSADPLGHGATPDLYSYAGGDPVNFVDPTGRYGSPTSGFLNNLSIGDPSINTIDVAMSAGPVVSEILDHPAAQTVGGVSEMITGAAAFKFTGGASGVLFVDGALRTTSGIMDLTFSSVPSYNGVPGSLIESTGFAVDLFSTGGENVFDSHDSSLTVYQDAGELVDTNFVSPVLGTLSAVNGYNGVRQATSIADKTTSSLDFITGSGSSVAGVLIALDGSADYEASGVDFVDLPNTGSDVIDPVHGNNPKP